MNHTRLYEESRAFYKVTDDNDVEFTVITCARIGNGKVKEWVEVFNDEGVQLHGDIVDKMEQYAQDEIG